MICDICAAPAHHVYADGDLFQAYCSICDRIGAEDAPMESGRRVAAVGVLAVLVFLAWLVVMAS